MNRRRFFRLLASVLAGVRLVPKSKITTLSTAVTDQPTWVVPVAPLTDKHVFFFADSAGLWRQYCETPLRGPTIYDYYQSEQAKSWVESIDKQYSRMA